MSSPDSCCSGRRLPTIKNLAVTAIVFATLELILGIALGLGLGGGIGQPLDGKTSSSARLAVCGVSQTGLSTCLNTVTSATLTDLMRNGKESVDLLGLYVIGRVGGSQYLFFAAGSTITAACVTIALGSTICKLVGVLEKLKV